MTFTDTRVSGGFFSATLKEVVTHLKVGGVGSQDDTNKLQASCVQFPKGLCGDLNLNQDSFLDTSDLWKSEAQTGTDGQTQFPQKHCASVAFNQWCSLHVSSGCTVLIKESTPVSTT